MATMPSIREFYAGRSVFITGATGFMGKVLTEKLLRSCPEINTIYLLTRGKRGVDPVTRVHALLDSPLFEPLRKQQPEYRKKVVPIVGDITEERLGISEADEQLLIRDVSVIFHSAATVRFDEVLKLSVQMNMVAVQSMIELARKLTNLECFLHVSTAYANCDNDITEEKIYPTTMHPSKLIKVVDWMSEDVLNDLTPKLIHPKPNTYTYTKGMAERILEEEAQDIRVAIVRPSIVGASWQDPFPGWVDNFNGPTGLLAAVGKGALRQMMGKHDGAADIIPVDTAINFFISAAWYTAVAKPAKTMIYNCTTEGLNTLTWGRLAKSATEYFRKMPLDGVSRLPVIKFTSSRLRRNMGLYLDHLLPAWLMDGVTRVTGGKPKFMAIQNKLWRSVEVLEYFTSLEWHWTNDNMLFLKDQMHPADQKEFDFDVRNIDWDVYLHNYFMGTKNYALKEKAEKMHVAKRNIAWLQRRDTLVNIALAVTLWGVLAKRYSTINDFTQTAFQQGSSIITNYSQIAVQHATRLPSLMGL